MTDTTMPAATILSLAGVVLTPPVLSDATLILIDYQNEYLSGPLTLVGADVALERAAILLQAARAAGTPIIHVAHRGEAGDLFDRGAFRGAFIPAVAPVEGEAVVEKTYANAFAATDLEALVGPAGTKIVVAGFMTHNCVSSTVRAARDRDYSITVAGDACATRDLPLPSGVVHAVDLHRATLAALADTHGLIADVAELVR